jgi:hypothetical protein
MTSLSEAVILNRESAVNKLLIAGLASHGPYRRFSIGSGGELLRCEDYGRRAKPSNFNREGREAAAARLLR